MEIKNVSSAGLVFISNEEGIILKPYLDSVGIPTIGVGNTYYENGTKVRLSDNPITKQRALLLFKNVLAHYENTVWSVTRDDINQNQFDSLVSICYNIGIANFKSSTLLKKVNISPSDTTIESAFLMWRNAGNKKGILLNRRKREAALYFK